MPPSSVETHRPGKAHGSRKKKGTVPGSENTTSHTQPRRMTAHRGGVSLQVQPYRVAAARAKHGGEADKGPRRGSFSPWTREVASSPQERSCSSVRPVKRKSGKEEANKGKPSPGRLSPLQALVSAHARRVRNCVLELETIMERWRRGESFCDPGTEGHIYETTGKHVEIKDPSCKGKSNTTRTEPTMAETAVRGACRDPGVCSLPSPPRT